jgi:alcohol dehydrogenase
MTQFMFSIPTRIEFGSGKSVTIGTEIAALVPRKDIKAMIVTDSGVRNAGLLSGIEQSLKQAGIDYFIFDKVEPNPKDNTVHEAAAQFQNRQADVLIAVGGGSVMDLSKATGIIAAYGGKIADYDGFGKVPGIIPPLIVVPTTSGTASEVTFWAIITNEMSHVKMGVGDLKIAPKIALVDPLLTISLPRQVTLGTGLDALTHAIESYTSKPANPPSDSLAIRAIQLISTNFPKVLDDGRDERGREGMMLGSLLAGMSFTNADCAAVHSLSESIGGLYDAPHGIINGILLPYVMAFNLPACPKKFADIASALGIEHSPEAAVKHVSEIERSFKIPGLTDFGVRKEDFSKLAEMAIQHPCTQSNPRTPTFDDFVKILDNAFNESPVLE